MATSLPDAVYRRRRQPKLSCGPALNEGAPELGYASYDEILKFGIGSTAVIERLEKPSPATSVITRILPSTGYWKKLTSRYWNFALWETDGAQQPVRIRDPYAEKLILARAELMIVSEVGIKLNIDTAQHHIYGGAMIGPVTLDLYERFFDTKRSSAGQQG